MSEITRTAVIGSPIEHSLSPTIHNHWFTKEKMKNHTYDKIEVELNNFSETIDSLNKQGLSLIHISEPTRRM